MGIKVEARGCREDTNERSAQIWNNQMNEERNIVLRFKPYSLLASLITRTINKVAFGRGIKLIMCAEIVGNLEVVCSSEITSISQGFG